MNHATRRLIGAAGLTLGLALAGLAPAQPVRADDPSLAGAYLASRAASAENDLREAAHYLGIALALDPDEMGLVEQAMIVSIGLGDIETAAPLARRILDTGRRNHVAEVVTLTDEVLRGDYEAARNAGSGRQVIGPMASGLSEAWAHLGAGAVTEAFEAFARMERAEGLASFAAFHRALALAHVGDFEGAEAILSGDSGSGLALGRRGVVARLQVLSQLGEFDQALAILESQPGWEEAADLIALHAALSAGQAVPFDLVTSPAEGIGEVLFTVAAVLEQDASPAFVLVYAQAASLLRPNASDLAILIGRLFDRLGQAELSQEAYARVGPDDPLHLMAQIGRVEMLFRNDRLDEGLELLRGLAELHPESESVFIALGDGYRRSERFAESAEAYTRAIELIGEIVERHWPLLYSRAIAYERSGNWPAAEADFRAALALRPDQPFVLNYLGYSLVERRENLEEALEMIERAVAAEPESGAIVDSLAWALYRLGRFEEAVEPMERAAALDPVHPVIQDHLGDVYWAVGRFREARFQWRRALSFGPDDDLDMDRVRRKLEVGLDQVLIEEGMEPHFPVGHAP